MRRRRKVNYQELRRIRKEAGYTQEQLGQLIGLSRYTVINIEKGDPETIDAIAADVMNAWWDSCRPRLKLASIQQYVKSAKQYFNL